FRVRARHGEFSPCRTKCLSDQAILVRERRGGGAGGDVQFVEDVGEVPIDRLLGEKELRRDRLVRFPRGHEKQDLELPRRESVRARRRRVIAGRLQPREIRRGAERSKDFSRGIRLETAAFLVAEGAAGLPDEDAYPRGEIGRPEAPPD